MKKAKLFWSYRIDHTEQWLSQMARDGYHLTRFNPLLRLFSFDKGPSTSTSYAIQYDKTEITSGLLTSGWETATTSGKWRILKNESLEITSRPMRDAILRRTRLHAYIFLILSTLWLTLQFPFFFIWGIASHATTGKIMVMPILIPLIIFLSLAGLTVFIFRAYRKFEVKEMGATIEKSSLGQKVRKLRLGWMYQPLQTKEWLERLALEGLELESVTAAVFTFRETKPQLISYEVSFEPKVNTDFYSFHQDAGWKLKFTSNTTWLNYSIWAMPYEKGEEVPAFSYDTKEKMRYVRRAFAMNLSMGAFILLVSFQSLYVNIYIGSTPFFEWSLMGAIRILLVVCILAWIVLFTKIIAGYRREMKMLHL
ncbi:DUF2812 domain-containing protein [Sporosarcina sp. ACRSL]|uniref:DUF2812 domain-containing protein n=1 Tax=Sporosarcina sp. ACRSL TaxID=2918215 RepID=UPI001EF5C250|nr:DUF2812 domain-containing protein [Sporosarcina sp. ACRSL]MCG7343370.1 DUF2812 domain-containing protein [Sporosarcina sp. ACRSL]